MRIGFALIVLWLSASGLGAQVTCPSVQCPPAGATTTPFCQAASDGVCTDEVTLPSGFEWVPGSAIEITTPDGGTVDISLSDTALGQPGAGGVCCGIVARATEDRTLYRAWAPDYDDRFDAPPGYVASGQFGGWWSADPPDATSHGAYRHAEAICISWDALTVYSACTLPAGTQVFVGPGQSACCPGVGCTEGSGQACPGECPNATYYMESPTLQIYLPSVDQTTGEDTEGTYTLFTDCETYVWPRGV
jgi:hypothetical protein